MRNMVFLVIISGAVGSYGSVSAADAAHCAATATEYLQTKDAFWPR